MEVINNVSKKLRDDLKEEIKSDSRLSIAAACFSIYAFEELRKELEGIEELRFIFTSPSFTTEKTSKERKEFYIPRLNRERGITGTEFEIKLRNELSQKAIARECADWIRRKVIFKSNTTDESMMGFMNVDDISYMPITSFTTAELGCEKRNNAYSMINKFESPFSNEYIKFFNSLWNSDKMEDVTDKVIENISAVYKENSSAFIYFVTLYNKITDNPLNENFSKKEFQELWKAISPKYVYKVDFDSNKLIRKSIDYINAHLNVRQLQYVIRKGEQKDMMTQDGIEAKDSFTTTASENRKLGRKASSTTYDLVGRLSKATSLTRRTVVAILKGLDLATFDMFKLNPEDFIAQVSKFINYQKATMIVEHISYSEAQGVAPYDPSIFTAEKVDRELIKAYEGKKSVQRYMFLDGKVEEVFAKEMDIPDNEVYIYAKLPRGFQIPTPMGNYAPDWAIVFHQDKVKHIFFVAETKGTLDSEELRGIEDGKISCAKKLFSSIRTRDIHYEHVSTYQDLMNVIMR